MNVRSLVSNTLALLCHCVFTGCLFGSQAPPQNPNAQREEVTIESDGIQEKTGSLYHLTKNVEIKFRDYDLRADEVTYNEATGEASAKGRVELSGGEEDLLLKARHATYNIKTENGRFYDVNGTAGMDYAGGSRVTLRTDNPFVFQGKFIEKIGKRHYILHDGMVTSCTLPNPKWTFRSGRIDLTLHGVAKMYNASFRIRDIPVVYLPFAEHPAERAGRQSGFLVPTFGNSSRKGFIAGDSFYWAMGRSMDATLGAEYFSTRGWAQHGDIRARPNEQSSLEVNYFGVLDRGLRTLTAQGQPFLQNQGGEDIKATGVTSLPFGFQGGIDAEYLSRYLFRLAWTESFVQAVNSEVKSSAFASRARSGYDVSITAGRYQNFQSTNPGDVIEIRHAPSVDFSSAERAWWGPTRFSFDLAGEGLTRSQPPVSGAQFAPHLRTDGLVGRIDVHPAISVPVFLRGWTFRPELAARNTYYSQRLVPNSDVGVTIESAINRRDIEARFEMRPPTLARVFDKPVFGRKIKHTIEPRIAYSYVNGIDNFGRIIRFDDRDIASNTNEVEYGIVQRIYTKRNGRPNRDCHPELTQEEHGTAGCSVSKEFITWELKQKFFIDPYFGGAVINGVRNVFSTSEELTGVAFITGARSLSPLVSRLRVRSTDKTEAEWALDYDPKTGRLISSNFSLDYKLDSITLGASHTYLETPGEVFTLTNALPAPVKFNQYRLLAGYGGQTKRGFSFAGNVGVDAIIGSFQYSAAQTSYSWDCCGVSFEYRRFGLGSVRNENQFRFAFTLANVGAFGNMRRQERIF
jgi:LPS-assembly protein